MLRIVFALVLCGWVGSVHALLITTDVTDTYVISISELDISGTFYEATFHPDASFDDLFDPNHDLVLDRTPMFWGQQALALEATQDIIAILSDQYASDVGGYDHFYVPLKNYPFSLVTVDSYMDYKAPLDIDLIQLSNVVRTDGRPAYPYVTFEYSTIPEPPSHSTHGTRTFRLVSFFS
ncbi:MAG: hypothetical protein IME94_10680 [Proteobacteria bacterium]|nr:hypothetical protein [Pseudomonadota bacterium]